MKAERSATNGGRALNAIWECQGISSSQAIIMLYLGSQLDFRGDFTEFRWCSVERIAHATKLSQRQIFYHFKDLIARGYLAKQNRFKEGRQLSSAYALTDKVFDEYVETLKKQAEMSEISHATIAAPGVQPLQGGPATIADRAPSGVLPQKELPKEFLGNGRKRPEKFSQVKEAEEAIALAIDWSGFVDRRAVAATAKTALERHGIGVIRKFRDLIQEGNDEGRLKFNQRHILSLMEDAKSMSDA